METFCPTEDILLQFLQEQLSAEQERAIEIHTSSCALCQQMLDRLMPGAPRPRALPDELTREVLPPDDTSRPQPSGSPASPPVQVPGYELLEPLGRGGMGVVYKARDLRLDRPVAIKFLPLEYARDTERLARFHREARTASALNHPHICTIHVADEQDGHPYIVMELIEGHTLREWVGRPQPVARCVPLLAQVARALGAAHAAGVIHRDIKPDNVMARVDGYVKVLDFGLARRQPLAWDAEATGTGTELGRVVGTPQYMSPEQTRGEALNGASDIFSLGIVLYELLTGRHPFPAASLVGLLHAIQSLPVQPASQLQPEIPVTLEDLLAQMLHKDPRLRPTASAVATTLEELTRVSAPVLVKREAYHGGSLSRSTVGRERELAALQSAFASAVAGRGLVVCITGEAGIGKTTLVESFLEGLGDGSACSRARGRCSERLAGTEAYLPVLEALDSLLRGPGSAAAARLLRTLAPTWHVQLTPADSAVRHAAEAQPSSQERLKRELVAFFQELTAHRPVLLFLDDLHWADASTVDLLAYLARKCAAWRLLVVLTYRPTEMLLQKHPFLPIQQELQGHRLCREVAPGFLSRADIEEYLDLEFPGHCCPEQLADLILSKTEGNPLFMVDLLHFLRDQGAIARVEGEWQLTRALEDLEGEMPASVRSMIQRKIDQLSDPDRRLLMAASLQCNYFDSAVLARVLSLEAAEVEERLAVLERVHALVRSLREQELPNRMLTVCYTFVHALYQEALFNALQPTRKAAWSAATAQALLDFHGTRSAEVVPKVAFLLEMARDAPRAAEYCLLAAQNATHVFAYHEAANLAQRGLAQLQVLPESPVRDQQELQLQLILGGALQPTRGYGIAETGRAYARACSLCRQPQESPELFLALWGLWLFHLTRSELARGRELAEELLRVAQRREEPVVLMQAHAALEMTTLHQGEFSLTIEHYRAALSSFAACQGGVPMDLYDVEPEVGCRCDAANALWTLGYPDQALECMERAVMRVHAVSHPPSLCLVLYTAAIVHQRRGEVQPTRERAEELIALSEEHRFPTWVPGGNLFRGWAQIAQGQRALGIMALRQALKAFEAIGTELGQLRGVAMLVQALVEPGEASEAQTILTRALAKLERLGERFFAADLYCLQGELLAREESAQGTQAEAESWFRRAIEVARRQQAKSLELRAAISLSRLYQRQGRGAEIRPVLEEIYGWFTEGLETADLRAAQTLLQELT